MSSRREFLCRVAAGATAAAALPVSTSAAAAAPASAPPPEKISARHRQIFNGDTCTYFYNPEKWLPEGGPYTAKAIHRFVDTLADSGIDTFAINANASRAWYPSKVIPTIIDGYRRGDREYCRGHAICANVNLADPVAVEKFLDDSVVFLNRYLDLKEAGVDWLAETAVACRRRGVAPWVSIRMNDMHGHRNYAGSYFNLPLMARPEMRLHRSAYSPTQWIPDYRGGLNYERAEVRAQMFAQIKEVVEDYDFDGLELDWWRNALCCEPGASAGTVAMMNDWFRSIRALTQRRAQRTGRPYAFGFRMPGRLGPLKSIGLDGATLCREGTLDFVVASHFWRTAWDMPHDELRRELGDRVAIYGGIEDGVNWMPTRSADSSLVRDMRYTSSSRELMRGNAAGKLVLGADGLEWYNFVCTDQANLPGLISDYAGMRDLHRLDWLRGQPKHYSFSDKLGLFQQIPFENSPQVSAVLERGWHQAFRLPMCAEPADRGLELAVQIVLRAADPSELLHVSFNGCWPTRVHTRSDRLLFPCGTLTHHVAANTGCNFTFPITLARDGWNEIVVENGGAGAITVVGVELAIRSRAGA